MRHCSICRIGKQLHEFESVRGNCWRNECRECRRVQRKQRTRTGLGTNANDDDTASMMSGGAVTQATDGDYEVPVARDLEERMRDSLRPLEEQLRALTDEHRKGSMPSIGQRLVQLEHEMQSLRGAMAACGCSGRDPLWHLFVWLACTTLMFVLLRWVEGRLLSKRSTCTDVSHTAVPASRETYPT
jgi:hypothetical protein